jgi:hypothetical protein
MFTAGRFRVTRFGFTVSPFPVLTVRTMTVEP